MRRVYFIYCLSGLVTLGYQIVWFRLFDDQFGATNITFALVICCFIGGLGAGAMLSSKVCRVLANLFRIGNRLRLYGLIELLIAATALLAVATTLIPADSWGAFPYVEHNGVFEPSIWRQFSKVGIAAICVFIPCFFMGTTFPLLCDVFKAKADSNDAEANARNRFPAALYAWNTLGACSSVLLCQFVLLRSFTYDALYGLMIAINALLGLSFLVFPGKRASHAGNDSHATFEHTTTPATVTPKTSDSSDRNLTRSLLLCALLGGLLTGALEGDALKRVWFFGGTSHAAMAFVSFWSILAIFLAACLVRVWPSMRLAHIKVACIAGAACYFATSHFAYPIRAWLSQRDIDAVIQSMPQGTRGTITVGFQSSLSQVFVFVGLFVFPPMLMLSLLLPYACNRLHAAGKHIGKAVGLNTLAFCVGVIGFTVAAPSVNIFYALKLFFAFLAIGIALLMMIRERGKTFRLAVPLALVVFAAACRFVPTAFDPALVLPNSPPAKFAVHTIKSNGANTTFVVDEPAGARLYFDNHPMSGTAVAAQRYMRVMAHFPLLAHDDPKCALLIGFGVGNTASAIAKHPTIEQLDIIELNRGVIETAPAFANSHHNVHRDHRVRFILDDGRSFLSLTDQRYDLITSEPPPPMQAGMHRLYSQQYYDQARAKLTDSGLMTQWLPAYQMPRVAVDRAIRTFTNAFPHTLLITGFAREFILIGSKKPIELRTLEQRFEYSRQVTLDLQAIGLNESVSMLARIVKTDAALRQCGSNLIPIDDRRNDLALMFTNPAKPMVIHYDPRATLEALQPRNLNNHDHLAGILRHMGRLLYHVPDFPRDTLATIPMSTDTNAETKITMADADWHSLDLSRRDAARAAYVGRREAALDILQKSLTREPEQPLALLELAKIQFLDGQFDSSLKTLDAFVKLEPQSVGGHRAIAEAYIQLNQLDRAITAIEQCILLRPKYIDLHMTHAKLLADSGRTQEAIAAYDRVLALDNHAIDAKLNRDALRQQNN